MHSNGAILRYNGGNGLLFQGLSAGGATTHITMQNLSGHVGLGVLSPLARLHVAETQLRPFPQVLFGEDLLVEDTDAVLGLLSDGVGVSGSAISLKEINPNRFLTGPWGELVSATVVK